MRLIDADFLIEKIRHTIPESKGRYSFMSFVDDIPTAYDVEKVVERLEEKEEEHRKCWSSFDDEDSFGAMQAYENAIKIVKDGLTD